MFFPCVHVGGIFPGTHTPARPSHTSPWNLSAKLRQHHTGLLRSLNSWNSHWRKRSRDRSFLQLARKVVSSHSQSSRRPPLLHTQMEKYSKQRIPRQLHSGSRAISSCFSSVPQTQEGLSTPQASSCTLGCSQRKCCKSIPFTVSRAGFQKGTAWGILCRKGQIPTGSMRALPSGR